MQNIFAMVTDLCKYGLIIREDSPNITCSNVIICMVQDHLPDFDILNITAKFTQQKGSLIKFCERIKLVLPRILIINFLELK